MLRAISYSNKLFVSTSLLDKTITWNLDRRQFSCSMNNHHLEVKPQKPCLIGPHIPYLPKMKKQICVLPIIKRVSCLEKQSTICIWFYNDDKLEYDVSSITFSSNLLYFSFKFGKARNKVSTYIYYLEWHVPL